MCIDLVSHNLAEHSYYIYHFDIFMQVRAGLIFSSILVISFLYHILLVRTLNRNSNRHLYVIPEVNVNIFLTFHHLSLVLIVGFLIDSLFLDAFQVGYGLVKRENTHRPHTRTYTYTHTLVLLTPLQCKSRLTF